MLPTLELIRLMLKAEHDAEAQRCPQLFYRDDFADEQLGYLPVRQRDSRITRVFNLPRRR